MGERMRYITGIDGLRAIAVLGVIGYHLLPKVFTGGFLGVPLFFVISGYLMTDILYRQWMSEGTIHLKNFYWRRLRRLVPSLVIMLVVSGSLLLVIPGHFLNQFRGVVTSSLLYFNNWWQLANGGSYFAQFSEASPFAHLWSLSIEGQFYLIWPLIFIAFMTYMTADRSYYFRSRRHIFMGVILGGAILSAIEMALLYQPDQLNRVYYGTDTRLFSLLLGALLAFLVHNKASFFRKACERMGGLIIGLASIIAIFVCYFFVSDKGSATYYGGMFEFSLVSLFLLATVILCPPINRLLTNRFFHYIGTRSYEIYLWQYPVMIVYENVMQVTGKHPYLDAMIELVIILILSELTYRLVRWMWEGVHYFQDHHKIAKSKVVLLAAALCLLFTGTFSYAFATAPAKPYENVALKNDLSEKEKVMKEANKKPTTKKEKEKAKKRQQETQARAKKITVKEAMLSQSQLQKVAKLPVTAIGDSVLLGASSSLQGLDPQCYVDAKVGRQATDLPTIVSSLQSSGVLYKNVVIALGTNGEINREAIDKVIKAYPDHRFFLVTVRVPRPWESEVNTTLKEIAKDTKATLVNWYSLANQHSEWFGEDQVHMGNTGNQIYANYLLKTILNHQ